MKRPVHAGLTACRRAAAPLLLALAALGASCGPRPGVPPRVSPAPAPFVRLPYLQEVRPDRAAVRWRTEPAAASRLTWRPAGDSAWRPASVQEGPAAGDRRALLEGITGAAAVEYRVTADGVTSGPHRFEPAPPDTASGLVRVLAFGDSGWGSDAQVALARRMEEAMAEQGWDVAVHVGDVAYPDGSEQDLTVRHFRVYAPLLARVPVRPVPGNHDVRAARGAPYDRAFGDADRPGRRYWRLRRGRVLFVGLDTSTGAARDSLARREGAQWGWLRAALGDAAGDSTVAWTVAVTHYPLYSRGAGVSGHGSAEELREALEPLFLRRGVDLVLAGHEHHYERSHPIRRGRRVEPGCGPVHLLTGGGGASRFARSVAPGGHAARVSRSHHFVGLRLWPGHGTGRTVDPQGRVIDRFRLVPYEPGRPSCE